MCEVGTTNAVCVRTAANQIEVYLQTSMLEALGNQYGAAFAGSLVPP